MRGDPASTAVWTVPNILSLVRLILSVVVFVLIVRRDDTAATILFLVASTTDWVDGWYARRFNQVSRLGRIFDPLVDKVLVCGSFTLRSSWPTRPGRSSPGWPW